MAIQERIFTAEEFWELYAGKPYELIDGRLSEVAPTGGSHGSVASRFITHLRNFVDPQRLGEVYSSETGFLLKPGTVRGADAAFVSRTRLRTVTEPEKFIPFAPDLAVEVVSPGDTATEVQQKVDLYLSAGTALVLVAYPELTKVMAYRKKADTSEVIIENFTADDVLSAGDVLPGFQIAVRDLFPPDWTLEQDEIEQDKKS